MAITVNCPSCNTTLRVGDQNLGKKMRCPSCKEIFKAPDPEPNENPDAPQEEPVKRGMPKMELDDDPPDRQEKVRERDPEPRPSRNEREDDDEDEDDRDQRRSRHDDNDEDDRPRRSRRDDDDDYDRPRRSRRDDDYDDDYDDRPRRSRRDDDDDYDDRPRRRRQRPAYDRAPEVNATLPRVFGIIACCVCWIPALNLIGFILALIGFIIAASSLGSLPRTDAYRNDRHELEAARTTCVTGMCLDIGVFLACCFLNIVLSAANRSRF